MPQAIVNTRTIFFFLFDTLIKKYIQFVATCQLQHFYRIISGTFLASLVTSNTVVLEKLKV
jgi:hypothetical protein